MSKPYTYSKLMLGLQVSLDMLSEKITKAKKNKDMEAALAFKKEYDMLEEEYRRHRFTRQICGDETVLVR